MAVFCYRYSGRNTSKTPSAAISQGGNRAKITQSDYLPYYTAPAKRVSTLLSRLAADIGSRDSLAVAIWPLSKASRSKRTALDWFSTGEIGTRTRLIRG